MNDDKEIEVLCKGGCGTTFKTFLTEMKEQNTKAVCPKCGKVHDYDPSAQAGKDRPPKP
ncbi:MAG: hypothetical protein M3P27_00530 [Acidobacteriota bacterium]|nr:hypothetical protein [Acidobacteriota bacterium]